MSTRTEAEALNKPDRPRYLEESRSVDFLVVERLFFVEGGVQRRSQKRRRSLTEISPTARVENTVFFFFS